MIKKIILLMLIIISVKVNAQVNESLLTQNFLGYSVGSKYTPHHKVVAYCNTLAKAYPNQIKLQQYGSTNQGRELLLAYISSTENMQQLNDIREQNLKLVKAENSTSTKAIVWLSFNVHGNEPASTEAALLTLEQLLVKPTDSVKKWLQNTVVIIDPCLNPDGRDRYVNWYNGTVGNHANADAQTTEHSEPWPQGRTNHYGFDLNRDWAWQTQVESKARIKAYLQWMPQVHVDFHEQGYNDPYYFAPAAQPMHQVITPWQQDFQTTIGKNHTQYFDANNWLYFTKERFDLFYPSYGDTYPTYNGSIGMTYEQGGIAGGLAIATNTGDTLTLTDRALHHFTTAISTIQVSSNNNKALIQNFTNYFKMANNGNMSAYKTFVITDDNYNKIKLVADLLDNNGISYGEFNGSKGLGYNYYEQKETAMALKKYTIAVSTSQPQGVLASVLLEPKSYLTDSATYDITAWSVPYVYGVQAFASKEKTVVKNSKFYAPQTSTLTESTYGYIITYNCTQAAQALAYLSNKNIKIRTNLKAFTLNKIQYPAGSLLVLKNGNANKNIYTEVLAATQKFNLTVTPVNTGFVDAGPDFGSSDVVFIKAPKVAMLTGNNVNVTDAAEVWHFLDNTLQYPVAKLDAAHINNLQLNAYNVLIMPDGNYRSFADKNVVEKIENFVKQGGKLIAISGAVNTVANWGEAWSIKSKKDNEAKPDTNAYVHLKKFGNRDREYLNENIPGAIYKVELDTTHPLAFGYNSYYYTLKQDANIYEFMPNGWNVGVIKQKSYVAGFTGYKIKNKLHDATVFGVTSLGNGQVVYLADNPIFRQFWENGKLLLANSIFMVQ